MKPMKPTLPALAAALAAAAGLAGCDMGYHPAPTPVAASAPTISYRYSAETDLPLVRSEARDYCASFDMQAHLADVADNGDGTRTAHFDCNEHVSAPAAPPPAVVVAPPVTRPPLVSYGYATPQQYATAANNANAYCQSYGAGARQVNVVAQEDGMRTVTFSCDRPL